MGWVVADPIDAFFRDDYSNLRMGWFADALAERLYDWAHIDSALPANPVKLAEHFLGDGCVEFASMDMPGDGMLAPDGEDWVIFVRPRLRPHHMRFVILHELAHWVLGPGATEDECDALAAALLVPRRVFIAAMRDVGTDMQRLARHLDVTESFVALRMGEVTGEPVVLVTPQRVRVRGETWNWPSEHTLREAGSTPGIRKTQLTDDRRRVVLSQG